MILGEPDVYPLYACHKDSFCFGEADDGIDGIEYIELRFDEKMYVSSVEVFEVFAPGAVS